MIHVQLRARYRRANPDGRTKDGFLRFLGVSRAIYRVFVPGRKAKSPFGHELQVMSISRLTASRHAPGFLLRRRKIRASGAYRETQQAVNKPDTVRIIVRSYQPLENR